MITKWTEHLKTEEEKSNFKRQFYNSSDVLERLKEIYKQRITQIETEERTFDAGWDYKMANLIGRREEIKGLLTLINLDQRKSNE